MTATYRTASVGRPRLVDPERYHVSFWGSLRAEIRKMTTLRSFWITAIVTVSLYTLIILGIAKAFDEFGDGPRQIPAGVISYGVSFIGMLVVVIGILPVTNEYSANTMRTTALASPKRPSAFLAKMTAVFVACGVVNLVLVTLAFLALRFGSGTPVLLENGNGRSLVMFWLALTLTALMSAGFGYVVRSTAGGMTAAFVFLYVTNGFSLVPSAWVRDTLSDYLPTNVMQAMAQADRTGGLVESGDLSWSVALAVWVIYTLVVTAIGFTRYNRSDI